MSRDAPRGRFLLGDIRVDPAALSIDGNGETVRIEAKVMQVLLTLADVGAKSFLVPPSNRRCGPVVSSPTTR